MTLLASKVVVVTGGGKGIGRGISRACARAGARLVLAGRGAAALQDAATEMEGLGAECLVVTADITKQQDLDKIVAEAVSRFGRIDGWVNNAGGAATADAAALLELDEGQWDRVVDINLKWTFFAMQAAARAMAGRGGADTGGAIVNITSRSGAQPSPMLGQYGAAKSGVDNLTATAAAEWGHLGIRVNAIAPGVVTTEAMEFLVTPERRRRQIETVPLGRMGTADDIGPLAAFLLSDDAAWITGEVVQVNGGSRIAVGLLTYLHQNFQDRS